jgi:hypothetical protein
MARPSGQPPGVDPTVQSVARIYDYLLGGADNYAVDPEWRQDAIAAPTRLRIIGAVGRRP